MSIELYSTIASMGGKVVGVVHPGATTMRDLGNGYQGGTTAGFSGACTGAANGQPCDTGATPYGVRGDYLYGVLGASDTSTGFDGTTDYVSLGLTDWYDNWASGMSMVFTYRAAGTVTNLDVFLGSKNGSGMWTQIRYATASSGTINWYMKSDSSAAPNATATGQDGFVDQKWHMMACTFNGSAAAYYIDGTLVNSNTASGGSWGASTQGLNLGSINDADTAKKFIIGWFGLFAGWDKQLSATDTLRLYNAWDAPNPRNRRGPMNRIGGRAFR